MEVRGRPCGGDRHAEAWEQRHARGALPWPSPADNDKAPPLRLGQPLKGLRERRKIAQGPLATSAAAQSDNRLRPEAAAAKAGGVLRLRACAKLTSCLPCPLLLCRYYVLMTASIAACPSDHLRHGTPAGWDPAEGTR